MEENPRRKQRRITEGNWVVADGEETSHYNSGIRFLTPQGIAAVALL